MRAAPALAALLALALPQSESAEEFDHDHAALSALLAEHVRDDRVDYRALKQEHARLQRVLDAYEALTPSQTEAWSEEQRFAFWINVYNAYALALVVDHYPVESIKDIGGLFQSVWKKRFIPLAAFHPKGADRPLSLDEVEHSILRPRFRDARLHAAVNCASIGCPPLRAEAYVAERLDEQLAEQTRLWLGDPRRNRADEEAGVLRLSRIFDWFAEDFEREAGSARAWVLRNAPEPLAEWMRAHPRAPIRWLDYSWKLNDVERED